MQQLIAVEELGNLAAAKKVSGGQQCPNKDDGVFLDFSTEQPGVEDTRTTLMSQYSERVKAYQLPATEPGPCTDLTTVEVL